MWFKSHCFSFPWRRGIRQNPSDEGRCVAIFLDNIFPKCWSKQISRDFESLIFEYLWSSQKNAGKFGSTYDGIYWDPASSTDDLCFKGFTAPRRWDPDLAFLLDSGHDGLRSLRGYRVGWCCIVFDSDITQYDTIWHFGAVWFRILKVLYVFGPFGPSSWLAEPPCLNDSSAGFEGMNHRKGGEDMTRTEKPAEVSELNGNENWIRGFHMFSQFFTEKLQGKPEFCNTIVLSDAVMPPPWTYPVVSQNTSTAPKNRHLKYHCNDPYLKKLIQVDRWLSIFSINFELACCFRGLYFGD